MHRYAKYPNHGVTLTQLRFKLLFVAYICLSVQHNKTLNSFFFFGCVSEVEAATPHREQYGKRAIH